MTDTEAIKALLPGTKWQMDESGELTMQMDGEYWEPIQNKKRPGR